MTPADLLDPALLDAVAAVAGRNRDPDALAHAAARAAWSTIVEPGDGVAGALIAHLGAPEALRACLEGGTAPPGATDIDPGTWREALARWQPRLGVRSVREALDTAHRNRVRLLLPDDPSWPTALDDLGHHAPLALWVRGDIAPLRAQPSVALVGARAATAYGEHVAIEFAAELSARGIAIVSGAAYGIDGAAHRATLAAAGTTLALLAGGADRAYPAGHTDLIGRIAASGAVVSEVPCGGAPTKWRFLQRNRLIAALGQATVVVEAGHRSGSLNTAGHAAALGRPLGAVPGPVTSAASAGCHRLLREFDARCVTSADDVVELLSGFDILDGLTIDSPATDDSVRVRDALSARSWRTLDDIAARSGLSTRNVEAVLGLLALDGVAESSPAGWRRRAVRR